MSERLADLPNLGEKSAQMLEAAGIRSPEQLRSLGPVMAYLAVRQAGQNPSMNFLWAVAAGIQNRLWNELSEDEKDRLRAELRQITESQ